MPRLLVGLTVVTGLVDAFSYLTLGHVFVANMTGNVVFFGFALAGVVGGGPARDRRLRRGRGAGGQAGPRVPAAPGLLLAAACLGHAVLVLASAVVVSVAGTGSLAVRLVLVALLALTLVGQNAVVRRLAVPDLTTTVLTLTVTGLVADASPAPVRVRRVLAVLAMLAGALVGGLLLHWVPTPGGHAPHQAAAQFPGARVLPTGRSRLARRRPRSLGLRNRQDIENPPIAGCNPYAYYVGGGSGRSDH